jgi:hypothetical protein
MTVVHPKYTALLQQLANSVVFIIINNATTNNLTSTLFYIFFTFSLRYISGNKEEDLGKAYL